MDDQKEMDAELIKILEEYREVFMGLGRAGKVPPIKIEIDPAVKPVHTL